MPIRYPVPPGTLLLCDYDTGFRPPEMVKKRPVVVVSPRIPGRDLLCTVVPLSTTQPHDPEGRHQCRIRLAVALPRPFDRQDVWAKADMLATVALNRLDFFRTPRGLDGKRIYLRPMLPQADLDLIRAAILHALGLGHLKP